MIEPYMSCLFCHLVSVFVRVSVWHLVTVRTYVLMFSRNGAAPSATDGSEPRVNSDVVSSIMD